MTHLQQIFEKCQHLTEEENNKLVAEYMKKNDEEAILQEI